MHYHEGHATVLYNIYCTFQFNFNMICPVTIGPFSRKVITSLCFALFVFTLLITTIIHATSESLTANHAKGSYWSIGQNMPTARNELTAVELNNKIYAMGGEDKATGGGQKDIVEVYDLTEQKWIVGKVSPMPLPLDHTASAVFDGKIYVVGGFIENKIPTDRVFVYDPEINKWKEVKSLPSPIGGALSAEFINGILYIVGGLNSSHIPVNTNYAYDPKTDTWTIKSPMPTARHHLASAALDNKLYAIGGRILGDGVPSEDMEATLTNFNRVEVYDPQTDTWKESQHMLTKRSGFAAASSGGSIYVFGGQQVGGEDTNSVEKYDPITDKWTFETPMPSARIGMTAVPVEDKIYVLGGQMVTDSGLVPVDLNEIFHIGNGQKQ